MNPRRVGIAAGLLAVGAVTLGIASWQRPVGPAAVRGDEDRQVQGGGETQDLAGTIEAMRREIAALSAMQTSLRARLATQAAPPTAPATVSGDGEEQPPEARPTPEEDRRERIEALDAKLAAEAQDREWSGVMESALRAAVEGPGARALETKCRSTMCRVEIEQAAPDVREQIVENLLARRDRGAVKFMPKGDRSLIYLARAGYGFP